MRTNTRPVVPVKRTHPGAPAAPTTPLQQLRRTVLSTLLFEKTFYEGGASIASRITELVKQVSFEDAAKLALEARERMGLRHVPLLITRELTRCHGGRKVGDLVERVIKRPDEIGELLALYQKDGKDQPLTKQLKVGIARAYRKFDEYQLAKYNRNMDISLKDAMFLTHPRPADTQSRKVVRIGAVSRKGYQRGTVTRHFECLQDKLARDVLATPDTWEVGLSAGKNKRETFTRLLVEKKLGALALLRNLRNMVESGVQESLIRDALANLKDRWVFPFRFVAAAKAAPRFECEIEAAMLRELDSRPKLAGTTLVVIDVSGSMYGAPMSEKSEMDRATAACALGAIARELCEEPIIYATAGSDPWRTHQTQLVPARRGIALVDAIHGLCGPLGGGGIFLKQVMDYLHTQHESVDRVIVITDEQDCGVGHEDHASKARCFDGAIHYLINVAAYANGINFGQWVQINGFSEAVFDFIREYET